jgi:hypothetical protein
MWKKMKDMRGKGREGGPEATRTFSMVGHLPLTGLTDRAKLVRKHGREMRIS